MRIKLAFVAVLALADVALNGGQWISGQFTLQQLMAALGGPSIQAGDRNGLNVH